MSQYQGRDLRGFIKRAADRATREIRKSLKADDLDRASRIAGQTSSSRPRVIKHLGSGAEAEAYLIHGGGLKEPTVAKVISVPRNFLNREVPIESVLKEPLALREILGENFARPVPLRQGVPYKKMTRNVGGLLQEWVPRSADLAPAIALKRRHFLDAELGTDMPAEIVRDRKNLQNLEKALWRAEARGDKQAVVKAQDAYFDARGALERKFDTYRKVELERNPAYRWAEGVRESPTVKANKVWDIADHAGNVRRTREGKFKIIDARIGSREYVRPTGPEVLEPPKTFKIRGRIGEARRIKSQAWLPELFREMAPPQMEPAALTKVQLKKKELAQKLEAAAQNMRELHGAAPRLGHIPAPQQSAAEPISSRTFQKIESSVGRRLGPKALGALALGLLGTGLLAHQTLRRKGRRAVRRTGTSGKRVA